MKKLFTVCFMLTALFAGQSALAELKKGETYQTLTNLHPDPVKRVMYAANYQLQGGMIPVCSDVKLKKVSKKAVVFTWKDIDYTLKWDRSSKKAGIPLKAVSESFFGKTCPSKKIAKMNKVDKEGVKTGIPKVGMSRDAVLIAMGPPPKHANPDLKASTWMYWLNKFKRKAIEFNSKGKVSKVRL